MDRRLYICVLRREIQLFDYYKKTNVNARGNKSEPKINLKSSKRLRKKN